MSDLLSEQPVDCPFCGELISIVVDLSAGSQDYVEDCQVCCQPMQVRIEVDGDELLSISANS
jgi:transcription elongation factor Elf1